MSARQAQRRLGLLSRSGVDDLVGRIGLVARVLGALVATAMVAAALTLWPHSGKVHVRGEFVRAVGLFPGSDVRILGVKVGEVTRVVPQGDHVAVDFQYDDKYRVPAQAKAVVVAPSLVSDRYVQLFPAYTTGPAMHDGATIGLERTAVPVELDRVSQSLDDLLVALGPEGANREGALSRLVDTSARNLGGEGQHIHDTNRDLSAALTALSGGRNDLFDTVKNLQSFTTMLATNDTQVRQLNADLATVSNQLDGERDDLSLALKNLAIALNDVSTFVHDNRARIKTSVGRLEDVTQTVAQQRRSLAETLTNGPVALSNLQNAYNPASGTLDTRSNARQLDDPGLFLCALVTGPTGSKDSKLCDALRSSLPRGGFPGSGGVKLPLNLLSSVPGAGLATTTVDLQGADPTLGGLLGKERR